MEMQYKGSGQSQNHHCQVPLNNLVQDIDSHCFLSFFGRTVSCNPQSPKISRADSPKRKGTVDVCLVCVSTHTHNSAQM